MTLVNNVSQTSLDQGTENTSLNGLGRIEMNLGVSHPLKLGEILTTSSGSYNLFESKFLEIGKNSTWDEKVEVRIIEKSIQSADHTMFLTFPASYYLKCSFLK